MSVAVKDNYGIALKEQQKEVINMVLAGLENIKKVRQKILMKCATDWRKNIEM